MWISITVIQQSNGKLFGLWCLSHKFKLGKVKSHLVVKLIFRAQCCNSKQIFMGIKATVTVVQLHVFGFLMWYFTVYACTHIRSHTYYFYFV